MEMLQDQRCQGTPLFTFTFHLYSGGRNLVQAFYLAYKAATLCPGPSWPAPTLPPASQPSRVHSELHALGYLNLCLPQIPPASLPRYPQRHEPRDTTPSTHLRFSQLAQYIYSTYMSLYIYSTQRLLLHKATLSRLGKIVVLSHSQKQTQKGPPKKGRGKEICSK